MMIGNPAAWALNTLWPAERTLIDWSSADYSWYYGFDSAITTLAFGEAGVELSKPQQMALCSAGMHVACWIKNGWTFLNAYDGCLRNGFMSISGLLCLSSGLNMLSNLHRLHTFEAREIYGLGGYTAATHGLVTGTMLAERIQKGDLLGATISAARLAAIVGIGNHPAIEAAAEVADMAHHCYRSWYRADPPAVAPPLPVAPLPAAAQAPVNVNPALLAFAPMPIVPPVSLTELPSRRV